MGKELAERPVTSLGQIKAYLNNDSIKARFAEMLGKRSSAFTNSLINVVRNSKQLQDCTPDSIMSAAIIPATLNLSVEPALGQSYIIAYGDKATFQIGYKGVIQLCIRSGQYAVIHCSEIYADELKSHNPITGQVKFKDPSTFAMRAEGNQKNVVGHYAYFKLVSGFEKADYMTTAEALAHARKYSRAYQYDLKQGKKSSPWSTDPIPMGNKTILLRLLKKFGIMSIEMQTAIVDEQSFEEAEEVTRKRIESEQGSEPVDVEFEPEPEPEPEKKPAKKGKGKKKDKGPKYVCDCENGKAGFDEAVMSGPEGNQVEICPHCFKAVALTPAFMED